MKKYDLLIGTITQDGYLKTDSGKVLLTKIPIGTSQNPEDGVELQPKGVGEKVLAKGNLSGDVLYSATVLETLTPFTENLVKPMADKGILSIEEAIMDRIVKNGLKKALAKEREKLCALVIGHKKDSPGSMNVKANLTEFDFNENLSRIIESKVQNEKIQRIYRRTWKTLPGDINELNPDFIISLHCNAFNQKVSGTETLYYYKSKKGKQMAEILQKHLLDFLKLPDRGIRAKDSEDRGGYLLRYTNAPCIIAEPFFLDNDNDLSRAQKDLDGLAEAYTKAIDEISNIA